ncbi:MAG: hypothetical protein KF709_08100 [Gemmatimonadaceae bacterium]|nr:hypothetical protein [Gemmatimonadaceae bacterium]
MPRPQLIVLSALLVPSVAVSQAPLPDCRPAPAVWTDYFAALSFVESPFEDVVGVHRMTAEEASRRNHFRLEYGADRRLARVVFGLGDIPRAPDHTGNALSEAPVTEICYAEGVETRRFRDAHGNPIYTKGNVAEERFTLDSLGYRRSLTFHDADGAPIQNGWGVARYEWSIEKDGTVIEERFDAAGAAAPIRPGFPFFRLRLHFGPAGYLALMENIDAQGRLVENTMHAAQDKLEFAADGQMLAWNVYDGREARAEGNGPRVARGIREFSASGFEFSEHYRDRNGASMSNAYGFTRSLATFDRFGNMLSRFNHDSSGQRIVNSETGYSGYVFRWDASGLRRLGLAYFAADGRPTLHRERGYHRTEERYDAAGDLVELAYLDRAGRPVNRSDNGVAVIRTRFDERHRPVHRAYFDVQGRPVAVGGRTELTIAYRPDGYPAR